MGLFAFLDGGQMIIRTVGGAEPDATILTICGMIGLCGVNDLGVGVAVNTRWQLPTATDGLPVACVARSIQTKPNLAAASSAGFSDRTDSRHIVAVPLLRGYLTTMSGFEFSISTG